MDQAYFDTARREILRYLPARVARLLDVGCGTGATTAAVKVERAVEWTGGIEYLPEVAEQGRAHYNRLWIGDAAAAQLEAEIAPGSLDLVLCLDVLEHMMDPWSFVQRTSALLAPGGRLIISVPNIRNYRFIWQLMVRGDFRYREFGLLDRTHLRFFVKETAVELASCGGLSVRAVEMTNRMKAHEPRAILNRLFFGRLEGLLAKQWLVVAEKPA